MAGVENRLPFQVLVLPYHINQSGLIEYALFKRADDKYWQGIAGGGENDEAPLEAAKREAFEEGNINSEMYITLLSQCRMPVKDVAGFLWGEEIFVMPEFTFGVQIQSKDDIKLSKEHLECAWLPFSEAISALKWDSNKTALWELNYRLEKGFEFAPENQEVIQRFHEAVLVHAS